MHSLMLYNERDMSPIQYTKKINGMASLVDKNNTIKQCSHQRKNFGEKTSLRYKK